jgi:hypothetical protein
LVDAVGGGGGGATVAMAAMAALDALLLSCALSLLPLHTDILKTQLKNLSAPLNNHEYPSLPSKASVFIARARGGEGRTKHHTSSSAPSLYLD